MASEKLIITQAIRDAGNTEWLNKARDNIRQKLINIEHGSGATIYRITNSSRPEVYIQITDGNDRLLMSDPVNLPEKAATRFAAQKDSLPQKAVSCGWLKMGRSGWICP